MYTNRVLGAGYHSVMFVQPAARYWRFQRTEAAIPVLGAVLLVIPVAYRVLRRPV